MWVDKGSEFYNRSIKSFLQNNNIEMYATHNEGKSFVAERFIRTVKNKIYKCLTSKNVYFDKLDIIVNKYNNTYHRTIKMELVDIKSSTQLLDIKSSTYIGSSKEINDKDSKFKIGDIVKISKYRSKIFWKKSKS